MMVQFITVRGHVVATFHSQKPKALTQPKPNVNNDDNGEFRVGCHRFRHVTQSQYTRSRDQPSIERENSRLQIQRPYGQSGHVSILKAKKRGECYPNRPNLHRSTEIDQKKREGARKLTKT